jgi:4-hydroxybenzoate polyprenyltransferase
MDPLYRQAILQGVGGLVFFLALVFGTAGTWDYWQGWAFLAAFAMSTIAFTVYLARYDKPLLERRMKAGPWHEGERSQKIVVSLILIAFFASIVLPVLDYRRRLSPVPALDPVLGRPVVAAPGRGADPHARPSRLYRIHAESEAPPDSVRVVSPPPSARIR